MASPNSDSHLGDNRRSWDTMATLHARGSGAEFYRVAQFLDGECKLSPWEIEEVGPVEGRSLLHLQCHIGLDTLSWARRGAVVTGLDFSTAAIDEARRIAEQIGVDARFVVGTVQEAATILQGEQFDILYTGRGALCWLPDLREWARQCALLTKPGGILYLEETHPTLDLLNLETDAHGVRRLVPHYDPYSGVPVSETSEGSYADRNARTGPLTMHCWDHGFGEILTSLVEAGFELLHLHERDRIFCEPWPDTFVPAGPHSWTFKEGDVRFPLSFTLKARRKPD